MKRSVTVTTVVLAAIAVLIGPADGAPKPSMIPLAWNLNVEIERPEPIEIYLPGEAKPKVFWYLRYKIINRTGEDQIFVPEFVLYTSTGQVLPAGRGIPASAFREIKSRHNQPLLEDMTGITGRIRQGIDNAKQGAAIWPDFDPEAGQFDIFVGGLSGETVEVNLPRPIVVVERDLKGNESKVTKKSLVLAKTLRLSYAIVGEAAARIRTPAKQLTKTWVMR